MLAQAVMEAWKETKTAEKMLSSKQWMLCVRRCQANKQKYVSLTLPPRLFTVKMKKKMTKEHIEFAATHPQQMHMQWNSGSWKNDEGTIKKCGNLSTSAAEAVFLAAADVGKRYLQVK